MSRIREQWRVIALSFLLLVSAVVMFTPLAGSTGGSVAPDLEYGLELDGGTRIRAPVVGSTATVELADRAPGVVEDRVAGNLSGVESTDVRARPAESGSGTVEVFVENVSDEAVAAALRDAGLDAAASDVREGVTAATRSEMVDVIQQKINEAGLSGGEVFTLGGEFVVIEVPGRDPESIRELLAERGVVEVVARYPANENGSTVYRNRTVLRQNDFTNIGVAQFSRERGDYVPVSITTRDADGDGTGEALDFANTMVETGFANNAYRDPCRYQPGGNLNDTGYCLLVVVDGDITSAFSVRRSLAESFVGGSDSDFVRDPSFIMTARNQADATEVQINLRAGSLPAPLDFDAGSEFTLQPALAEQFKFNSLLTGLVAVVAVSIVMFLRYGQPRVALPMILTAGSEVMILLGFASAISLPLDLSHIAGFIAVIGTGVDDLVIIADEVLSEGEVNSSRVFDSRFRRAFWVIGAAAATTVIAMTPLAFLSLGDLRGFAIITILGVLIGVFVTRPAYGSILRYLTTGE